MHLNIQGKVAVVTGASEGIGKAIAAKLVEEGAKVAISSRRAKELDAVAHEIRKGTKSSEIIPFAADMTNRDDVRAFMEEVITNWSTIHILVNNVGRAQPGLFQNLPDEDWRATFDANLSSALYCTKAALPFMQRQKWGRIINIGSISGKEPSAGLIASNSAKAALISFSKSLAAELAPDGILVNCVCPGRILSAQALRLTSEKEREEIASTHIPIRRFGHPEEVANLVAFLASECSSYIAGTAILVDGGMARGLY